jgi:2-keto-4-pentenoate hydratase/2-oxohepta-3-ene-1,7-dioic acid hydratase in catechol pathway
MARVPWDPGWCTSPPSPTRRHWASASGSTASFARTAIPAIVSLLSAGLTLEPGDVIATGTPSGVGYAMKPPQPLQDGDTVAIEIDGLGRLENTVRAGPSAANRK